VAADIIKYLFNVKHCGGWYF